jgi:cyclase
MNRALVVAKINPHSCAEVARIFNESDQSDLPRDIGVMERSLYALEDLYLHIIDFKRDPAEALRIAQEHPDFRKISDRLRPYISPYNPATWRSPQDAIAKLFYHWHVDH